MMMAMMVDAFRIVPRAETDAVDAACASTDLQSDAGLYS
jgi:hypothetical protein